jgi:predicted RNA-binding Zn-ribbon protein involved in translation (DUF1610 family)
MLPIIDLQDEHAKNDTKCPRCGASGDRWHRERAANGWENWCSNCGYAESGT